VGAKRGRLQMPAQDPQPVKRNTMQHQQHLHIAAKAAIGGSAADGAPTLPGGTSVQTQQQEQQGLPRQAPAAADIGSNQPPGTKGAAAGSQGQLAGASGSAGLPPLPAAAHQAGASLARLSLQQQQQALPLPPQQGPATQQLVAGGAGVQGLPAGGHSAGSGGLPVAAAAAAAASDHAGASLAQQQEALPLQQQAATQQAGVGQGAQQLGTGDQGVAAGGSKQAGSSAAVAEPGTGAVQQRQALPLQEEAGMQSACAAEGGQQLVVRGAGVQQAAAGNSQQAGSSAASAQAGAEAVAAVPGAPTAAAAVEVLQPGQVVVLTLMSLDKIPVSLGTYKLRVVRKLGAGGECSVWLVELQQDNASSSSSCAGGGSSGASAAPLPPTSATAAGLASGAGAARGSSSKPSSSASAGAGREQPAATYQRMQQLMALKVPFPYDLISADTQACVGRNQYNAAMRKSVVKECTLFAKCSSCDALVDTYGWGTVQLAVPAAVQQQQPPAVPSAAAAGGSSPAPPTVWELAVVLLEYAQHGSAAHQLRSCPPGTGLSPATTKDYIARVAKALVYLHKYHDTCHRDVKASNCLLFKAPPWRTQVDDLPQNQIYHLKLADLGIAKALPRGQLYTSTLRYTPSYRAPEVKSGHNHDFRVDTWGLGCLVLEFRSSLPPWLHIDLMPGLSPAEKEARRGAEELAREDCPYRKLLTPLELEFAATCLERDITKRPTPSHLLATRSLHRYFYASDR
jgi:serine/threonine protein kinase